MVVPVSVVVGAAMVVVAADAEEHLHGVMMTIAA